MPLSSDRSSKTYIYLATFLILLIFVVLFEFPGKKSTEGEGTVQFYPEFSLDAVSTISIKTEDGTIRELLKEKDIWKVKKDGQTYPADKEIINSFSDTFANAKEALRVSSNKKHHETYAVQDGKGLEITTKDSGGRSIVDVIVGKQGTFPGTEYVRIKGQDEVLLIPVSLRSVFSRDPDAFREKHLFPFEDNDKAAKLLLESEGLSREFEKKNGIWQLTGYENQLDGNVFDVVLTKVRTLQVMNYSYGKNDLDYGFADKPTYGRVVIKLTDGSKDEVWIGNSSEGNNRYIKSLKTAYVGVVNGDDLSGIFKKTEEFLKQPSDDKK